MRPMLLIGAVLASGVLAGSLWGDIPGPFPRPPRPIPQLAILPPPNAVSITIEVGQEGARPKLLVPRPLLEKTAARVEQKEQRLNVQVPALDHLLLALALVGGGLSLLRGRVRLAFAASLLLAVGMTVGSGRANPVVHSSAVPTEVPVRVGELVLDDVAVVVQPDGGDLKLLLPPSAVRRLGQ